MARDRAQPFPWLLIKNRQKKLGHEVCAETHGMTVCPRGGGRCPGAPPVPGPCAPMLPASRVCDSAQCPSRLLRPSRTVFCGAENGLGWSEGFSITVSRIWVRWNEHCLGEYQVSEGPYSAILCHRITRPIAAGILCMQSLDFPCLSPCGLRS